MDIIDYDPTEFEEILRKDTEPYIGTLVLHNFQVVRLSGLDQDDYDWYYIFHTVTGEAIEISVITGFVPLKGHVSEEDYKRLLFSWNLNSFIKAD